MFKRVFCIVIDSVGCGTAPLSYEYDDDGANTIKHISEYCNGLNLPTMESIGYGNLTDILGVKKTVVKGYYGKMRDAVNSVIGKNNIVLDAGCGEGYYTDKIESALRERDLVSNVLAFDISRDAVK